MLRYKYTACLLIRNMYFVCFTKKICLYDILVLLLKKAFVKLVKKTSNLNIHLT
jgi:hypothetical protein